jgi:hypothetical protein
MATEIPIATPVIQGEPGTTIRAAQAPPAAPQTTNLDSRALRDQIRQAIRAQIAGATQGAGAAAGVGAPQAPPTPAPPRIITIHGRDGTQTISIPPFDASDVIPPQAVEISIAFFITIAVIIIGLPLARAFSRRMDRKSTGGQMPGELSGQLAQLNQSVDAIALEVERISEGQRFTTRLLSEQRDAVRPTLPSGANR